MDTTTLKVKVLTAFGFLLVLIGALYAPQLVKQLQPFAICVVIVAVLFNIEYILLTVLSFLHGVMKATPPQAIKVAVTPDSKWCDHIDYDNYYIPSYLRRQGEAQ